MSAASISAVYFDAGDTLVRPSSGHWYVPPQFDDILESHNMPVPDRSVLHAALETCHSFLDANHQIQTEDEEADQFLTYYRLVFDHLGDRNADESLLRSLAHDMVYNDEKFAFFPDVRACLERLSSASVSIGILSNTWPSLERVFKNAGLYDIFDAFVVSSRVGCFKPDPRIYAAAVDHMGVAPDKTLFVDDSKENLAGGVEQGFRPLLISRYGDCDQSTYPCIGELSELPIRVAHS